MIWACGLGIAVLWLFRVYVESKTGAFRPLLNEFAEVVANTVAGGVVALALAAVVLSLIA